MKWGGGGLGGAGEGGAGRGERDGMVEGRGWTCGWAGKGREGGQSG